MKHKREIHNAIILTLEDEDSEDLKSIVDDSDGFLEYVVDDIKLCLHADFMVELRKFLQEDMAKPKYCPNCGGMLPELSFEYKGKRFRFTCYMIEENGKTLAKTDYAKFAKYCKATTKETKE